MSGTMSTIRFENRSQCTQNRLVYMEFDRILSMSIARQSRGGNDAACSCVCDCVLRRSDIGIAH
jgi:hypothetical protein